MQQQQHELFAVKAHSVFIEYEGAVPGLSVPFITSDGQLDFREWTETKAVTVRGSDSVAVRLEIGHG